MMRASIHPPRTRWEVTTAWPMTSKVLPVYQPWEYQPVDWSGGMESTNSCPGGRAQGTPLTVQGGSPELRDSSLVAF